MRTHSPAVWWRNSAARQNNESNGSFWVHPYCYDVFTLIKSGIRRNKNYDEKSRSQKRLLSFTVVEPVKFWSWNWLKYYYNTRARITNSASSLKINNTLEHEETAFDIKKSPSSNGAIEPFNSVKDIKKAYKLLPTKKSIGHVSSRSRSRRLVDASHIPHQPPSFSIRLNGMVTSMILHHATELIFTWTLALTRIWII